MTGESNGQVSHPRPLAKVVQARQKVDRALADADRARAEFRRAIEEARDAGYSLERIGQALGVTRQRVAQLLRGE